MNGLVLVDGISGYRRHPERRLVMGKIKGYWIINPKQGDNREEEYFYPANEVADLAHRILTAYINNNWTVELIAELEALKGGK